VSDLNSTRYFYSSLCCSWFSSWNSEQCSLSGCDHSSRILFCLSFISLLPYLSIPSAAETAYINVLNIFRWNGKCFMVSG